MIIVARVDVGCLLLGDRLNLSTDIVLGLYALLKCNVPGCYIPYLLRSSLPLLGLYADYSRQG